MTQSPEIRLLTRYGVLLTIAVAGTVIAPRAFANGRLYAVMLLTSVVSTRFIVVAPRRFAVRRATRAFRRLWYLTLAEVALLAVAFIVPLEPGGSVPLAWAAFVVAVVAEAAASLWEARERVRIGLVVTWLEYRPAAERDVAYAECTRPAERALENALADHYEHVPTVVRAYLTMMRPDGEPERRVLAIRFTYPWIDEDAVILSQQLLREMLGPAEVLQVFRLDDASERDVRAAVAPFYERVTAPRPSPR